MNRRSGCANFADRLLADQAGEGHVHCLGSVIADSGTLSRSISQWDCYGTRGSHAGAQVFRSGERERPATRRTGRAASVGQSSRLDTVGETMARRTCRCRRPPAPSTIPGTGPMKNATPYQECTDLLGDAAALRAVARERGYLFFRGRLPAAPVREVRRDVLQEIQRQGYLAPDTDWDDAVARRGTSLTAFDPNPRVPRPLQRPAAAAQLPCPGAASAPAAGAGAAVRRAAADARRGTSATQSSPTTRTT